MMFSLTAVQNLMQFVCFIKKTIDARSVILKYKSHETQLNRIVSGTRDLVKLSEKRAQGARLKIKADRVRITRIEHSLVSKNYRKNTFWD